MMMRQRIRQRLFWVVVTMLTGTLATRTYGQRAYRGEVYVTRDSGPLRADVYVPAGKGPFPALLVVHGGAWRRGDRQRFTRDAQAFARRGYTAATIDYRLRPEHKFPDQIHDCQAAVRWLRANATKYKVDPDRIGGYGYSAGGHLVALLGAAADEPEIAEPGLPDDAPSAALQVVLAGGAPCDFRNWPPNNTRLADWLGGTRNEAPDAYRLASPLSFASAGDPPMFFYHGTADTTVPIRSARRMVTQLKAAGGTAQLYSIDGAGHGPAKNNPEARARMLAFADRYLKGRAADGR